MTMTPPFASSRLICCCRRPRRAGLRLVAAVARSVLVEHRSASCSACRVALHDVDVAGEGRHLAPCRAPRASPPRCCTGWFDSCEKPCSALPRTRFAAARAGAAQHQRGNARSEQAGSEPRLLIASSAARASDCSRRPARSQRHSARRRSKRMTSPATDDLETVGLDVCLAASFTSTGLVDTTLPFAMSITASARSHLESHSATSARCRG